MQSRSKMGCAPIAATCAAFIFLVSSANFFLNSDQDTLEQKCEKNQQILDSIRPSLVRGQPAKPSMVLSFPYLIIKSKPGDKFRYDVLGTNTPWSIGTATKNGCYSNSWLPAWRGVKTLIVLKSDVIGKQHYYSDDSSGTDLGVIERYRFDLWAVDVRTQKVAAYLSLVDSPFPYRLQDMEYISPQDIYDAVDSEIAKSQRPGATQ